MLQFDSGLHRLIDLASLHDTYYKHLKYHLVVVGGAQTKMMSLKVQINYVVQANYDGQSFVRSVKFPVSELVACLICQESRIVLSN